MDKLKDRAQTARNHFLHYASGGDLTRRGKLRVVLICAVFFCVLNVVAIAADASNYTAVLWVLLLAFYLACWVEWEPQPFNCGGEKGMVTSPSGEIALGLCHGCESWVLLIRGDEVGMGKGRKSLLARLDKLASVWERNVPHVGSDLRFAYQAVAAAPDLKSELESLGETDADAPVEVEVPEAVAMIARTLTDPAKTVSSIEDLNQALASGYGETGVIVKAADYKEFCEWREANEREESDANA